MDAGDLTQFSQITRQSVEWVVDGLVPMGMLTVLAGPPKLGKSLLYCAWAKTLADDGHASILCNAEDTPEFTTKPRLEALRANTDLISHANVRPVLGNGQGDSWYRRIMEWIIDRQCDLFVLDPLSAFVDTHMDVYRDHHVRALLEPLDFIARETGCAIVYVKHLTKAGDGDILARISDSVAFTAAARSVVGLTREGDYGSLTRFVTHAASNVSELSGVQRWEVMPTLLPANNGLPETKTARIEYRGIAEGISALDVLAAPPSSEERGERERAEDLILDVLTLGEAPSRDLEQAAQAAGVSHTTMMWARSKLGVTPFKKGRSWYVRVDTFKSPSSRVREGTDSSKSLHSPAESSQESVHGSTDSSPEQGSLDWIGTATLEELRNLDNV